MWDSGGDITSGNVDLVFAGGDMHVSGGIHKNSFVRLVATAGSITVDKAIEGNSNVTLVSTTGSITLDKIDDHSAVTLRAAGDISINGKIDGLSSVTAEAGGDLLLGGQLRNADVDFKAHGAITVGGGDGVDFGATVRLLADGDVWIMGNIDGNEIDHGPSRVEATSNSGSVRIDGKIDNESKATLAAAGDIAIGADTQLSDNDRRIDGNSCVTATAGGSISLGGKISSDHTAVDFAAAGNIMIEKTIEGGAQVRLLSGNAQIFVSDGINGGNTTVTVFPAGALNTSVNGATINQSQWTTADALPLNKTRSGYWWENWPQTFGYVAPFRIVPHSVDEISIALGSGHVPIQTKAMGGAWSFTDATLPFLTQAEVDQASIRLRGAAQQQDMRNVLEGMNDAYPEQIDLLPQAVGRNVPFSTMYDQGNLRQMTASGAQLIASNNVRLIDMRALASSLNCEFKDIKATWFKPLPPLFHVEAGITMADLQQLLDHQHPRLAIQASGGESGATLGGLLSTASHGAEIRWPQLADCVRAVHLVGPGGEQWWIEGDIPIADQPKLQQRYPKLDPAHFIGAGWNGIPGLTSQDVLDAVVVSMGTMGVIYSVVLEVVPQFGLRQVARPTTWHDLVARAGATEAELEAGSVSANQAMLNLLIDGNLNGTGIAKTDNVYAGLAINPLNQDCWVVNRAVTPKLPDDPNGRTPDYVASVSAELAHNATNTAFYSWVAGRVLNFLSYATDIPANLDDLGNNASQAQRLLSFITGQGDALGALFALGSVQTVANSINVQPFDRRLVFLADAVTGFFHATLGTRPGENSDQTGLSHRLSTTTWPTGGLPGRGLEIALAPTNAFTFLQKILFDDILAGAASGGAIEPLIGYMSMRVCLPTQTLLGMQQYGPYSVMIEIAAYRSPQANDLMDRIQASALSFKTSGPKPLLHWGLENDQMTAAHLAKTPLGQPYKGTTRLAAFGAIRQWLRKGHPPVFDNNFTARMGL